MTKAPQVVPAAVLGHIGKIQSGLSRVGAEKDPYRRDDFKSDLDQLFEICAECGGMFDDGIGDGS